MNLISLFTMSILTQNIVLTKFLGLCPFMGTSSKEKNALSMGICVTFVVTISSFLTYVLYHYLLVKTHIEDMKTLVFILVIASMVSITSLFLKKFSPTIHESLGIYLPLITTNCAVLGITLLAANQSYTLLETFVFSIGSSIGFTLVIYVFGTIREKLENSFIPKAMKGYPLAFIIAAVMSLLFARYGG